MSNLFAECENANALREERRTSAEDRRDRIRSSPSRRHQSVLGAKVREPHGTPLRALSSDGGKGS